MIKPHAAIRIEPELPNSVALASRVRSIPRCQLARSAAKNSPPASTASSTFTGKPVSRWPLVRASKARNGIASASRQNPAETGPLSASRTHSGPSASATLPPSSAARCQPFQRAGAVPVAIVMPMP